MPKRKGWALPPSPEPYACLTCGSRVRTVVTTDGDLLVIDLEPNPSGYVIPWPAPTSAGMAQARILTVPVTDQDAWLPHGCR